MQSFTRKEIEWTAQEIARTAGQLQHTGEKPAVTEIERGLCRLRSEQFRSIAERLAAAAAGGDRRIAIR